VRSSFACIGIAALLVLGSAGCPAAPVPAADAETASEATPADDSACTPPEGPVDRPDSCSYPADVRAFIDDRDACDHWRGEPIPGPEDDPEQDRRKQILAGIEASCSGTDQRLSALKTAYAKDPNILQLLDEYETDIEADD
jgi:hypothetical protein